MPHYAAQGAIPPGCHGHGGLGPIPVVEQLSPGMATADHSLACCLAS